MNHIVVNQRNVRNSNIELLRILCMLMIVGEHLASYHNKGSIDNQDLVFTDIIRNFCACSVNTFVLISGYFGIKFKLPRLLDICNKAWFYSVFGLIISTSLGVHIFALRVDFLDFFPVFSRRYWFITVYVVLYLLSPFINGFVDSLSKENFLKFLTLGAGLFYFWPTLCWATNAPQLIPDAGYGIVNFVYLYVLGRYMRLHYQINNNKVKPLLLYILSCVALCFSQSSMSIVVGVHFTSFISYNTVFCLLASVGLFLFFLKFDFQIFLINTIAKRCLSVYFIHVFTVLKFVYTDILKDVHGVELLVVIPFFSVIIYLFCIFVDMIRDFVFHRIDQFILLHIENFLFDRYTQFCKKYYS